MRIDQGSSELKPDAAVDCLFTSPTRYQCVLDTKLTFHNGNPVTASDVRFSILRAMRLGKLSAGVSALESLQNVTVSGDDTVVFQLIRPDSQFGYALASPATAIVPAGAFDPDEPLPFETIPVGSGPYRVRKIGAEEVVLAKFANYRGPYMPNLDEIVLSITPDSASTEAVLMQGEAEAVWRSLEDSAIQRVLMGTDKAGYTRFPLPGARSTRLLWNPTSNYFENDKLREAISKALQRDRTLDSIIPNGIPGHSPAFAMGRKVAVPKLKGKRVKLTLGYNESAPGHQDMALLIRDRIESIGSVSVKVSTERDADLWLSDERPYAKTASGWLQPYLDYPLPDSAEQIAELIVEWVSGKDVHADPLVKLQVQASLDRTVLPVSQTDGILLLRSGVNINPGAFGSAGELGFWGFGYE
jgi:peptide/nickel transport system substrate-binding protein